jgi:hypothetical protein
MSIAHHDSVVGRRLQHSGDTTKEGSMSDRKDGGSGERAADAAAGESKDGRSKDGRQPRATDALIRHLFEGSRFGGRPGSGERSDPGTAQGDTHSGAAPGGRDAGGEGYRQDGYDAGAFGPAPEQHRAGRSRGWPGSGLRGPSAGHDGWRRGFGAYGMSESAPPRSNDPEAGGAGMDAGHPMFGGAPEGAMPLQRGWHPGEPWAVPAPPAGRGAAGYERSAAAIRDDVCDRLARHGRLDTRAIRVEVSHGEVTLEGEVDSRMAKRLAEDAAESVEGVRDVHNRLRIAVQE